MERAQQKTIIDSHFHVWYCPGETYRWPTRDLSVGKETTIEEYESLASSLGVVGAVFVQVLNDSIAEIEWINKLAEKHRIIRGIVGGVDITDKMLDSKLSLVKANCSQKLVGVRHILDLEKDPIAWLESQDVEQGLHTILKHKLAVDLPIRPPTVRSATRLASKFPGVTFIVDHIAKPYVKANEIMLWAEDIKELSTLPNVFCKISGMVTEIGYPKQETDHNVLLPYVKHIVRCFGTDRIMFGSDWPVCRMASYDLEDNIVLASKLLISCGLEDAELSKYFEKNAIRIYHLN